ncbi:MAG: MBOAT family protein [Betaproteobacteria bacterium]|nr:MBOAT family protein [Betaproteobacteria bacterium]
MLFNSYGYLFAFLPLALAGYFALRRSSNIALAWLVAMSLFFYAWWNPWHLPVVLGSMAFNFWVGRRIMASSKNKNRLLWLGIAGNLLLLAAFKYTHFALGLVADVSGWTFAVPQIALPLGISFFTFTQIAYLVDTARGEVRETNPVHYALFVTFFPHLLAGPILHHKEMMPQFAEASNRFFNAKNFARGLFLLALGFGKKVLLADPLGASASAGYANIDALGFADAWITTLAYTFQIYFDFSGYTDMALGAALMFNIRLPVNFSSPYLATDIQDFWRRWHITLSRFLRDYLYIPLGGNKASDTRIAMNVMATFLLGGLWHGAGWTFVVWGGLHGAALVGFRWWQRAGFRLHRFPAILLTFAFVHVTWVFFRAPSLTDALHMLHKLLPVGVNWNELLSGLWPSTTSIGLPYASPSISIFLVAAACLALLPRNSDQLSTQFAATKRDLIWAGLLLTLGMLTLGQVTQFLYFNF